MLMRQQSCCLRYLYSVMAAEYTHIVEGCKRHERKAQKALYDMFAPMAMGICMRYVHSREAAQEVLQDGFVLVFDKIGRLREAEKVGAWIRRVMVNESLKYCNRYERPLYTEEMAGGGEQVAGSAFDPFGTEEVVAALQRLAPAQRVVFNLMEVEGYTYAEVAKELRCSEVNVRALLSRAKRSLREQLGETRNEK